MSWVRRVLDLLFSRPAPTVLSPKDRRVIATADRVLDDYRRGDKVLVLRVVRKHR